MGIIEQYLLQLNTAKRRWRRSVSVLTVLSVVVALVTVWNLRMTGITIANSASCGYEEHQHEDSCLQDGRPICGKQPHIHNTGCVHTAHRTAFQNQSGFFLMYCLIHTVPPVFLFPILFINYIKQKNKKKGEKDFSLSPCCIIYLFIYAHHISPAVS